MAAVERHVTAVAQYLYDGLAALRHANGAPLVRAYGKHSAANRCACAWAQGRGQEMRRGIWHGKRSPELLAEGKDRTSEGLGLGDGNGFVCWAVASQRRRLYTFRAKGSKCRHAPLPYISPADPARPTCPSRLLRRAEVQGPTVNFQLLSPSAEPRSYKAAARLLAAAGFHLRTGCTCNPSACYSFVGAWLFWGRW